MGAPGDLDIGYYGGADQRLGGAIDTGTPFDQTTSNLLFDNTPANAHGGANIVHHGVGYRKNEEGAGGSCSQGKLYLKDALALPGSAGTVTLTATALSVAAEHKAKVSGINHTGSTQWSQVLTLANGTVTSGTTQKTGEHLRVEIVEDDGVTPAQCVETTGVKVTVGVTDIGVVSLDAYSATTEYRLAIADAKNTTIVTADVEVAPDDISAFSYAQKYGSTDSAIDVPDLADTDYFGYVLEKTLRAGFPPPLVGYVAPDVMYLFVAAA